MSFIVRIEIFKCDNCPYKIEKKEHHIKVNRCPKISGNPVIEYNSILKKCPYNKKDKTLSSILDYVKGRQNI